MPRKPAASHNGTPARAGERVHGNGVEVFDEERERRSKLAPRDFVLVEVHSLHWA